MPVNDGNKQDVIVHSLCQQKLWQYSQTQFLLSSVLLWLLVYFMYPDIPAVAEGTMGAAMGEEGVGVGVEEGVEDGGGGGGGWRWDFFTQTLQAGMTKRGRPLLK